LEILSRTAARRWRKAADGFVMIAGRTTKQGQQISSGKDRDDYKATVSTMQMHADDLTDIGILSGSTVRVRSLWGETTLKCVEGKVPAGWCSSRTAANVPSDGSVH
jgi:anaerobic selenocysteine-containing dehydrogenase